MLLFFVIPDLCDTAVTNAGILPGSDHLFYGYLNDFFRPITFSFPVDAVDCNMCGVDDRPVSRKG
jgi:hypothetical protein